MVLQHAVGKAHKVGKDLGERRVLPAREQRADDLAEVVVRRDKAHAARVAMVLHRQRTERGAGVDVHIHRTERGGKFGIAVERGDHIERVLSGDGAGRVGEDALFLIGLIARLERDEVAAERRVAGNEPEPDGGGLHRRAAGEMLERVAAEDGEDRGLAARGQRLGAVHDAADRAARGKGINGGDVGVLERRFAAEGLDGVVRHAVADDNKIFHRSASLSDDECSIAGGWAKIKDKSPRVAEISLLNGKRTGYPVRFVRFDDLNSLSSPMLSACGRDNRRERRVRCCACRSAVRARSRAGKGMRE